MRLNRKQIQAKGCFSAIEGLQAKAVGAEVPVEDATDHGFARYQTRNSLFLGILDGARFHDQCRRRVEAVASASASSAFASGNYVLMMKVTSVYQTPAWIVILLFCGVILWEALGT